MGKVDVFDGKENFIVAAGIVVCPKAISSTLASSIFSSAALTVSAISFKI